MATDDSLNLTTFGSNLSRNMERALGLQDHDLERSVLHDPLEVPEGLDPVEQAQFLEDKASKCVEIARRILHVPDRVVGYTQDSEIERIAIHLMSISSNGIDYILQRLQASNPSLMNDHPEFFSVSAIKEAVLGAGVIEEIKEVKQIKRENRYTILRRENEV